MCELKIVDPKSITCSSTGFSSFKTALEDMAAFMTKSASQSICYESPIFLVDLSDFA